MKQRFFVICACLLLTVGITSSFAATNSSEPKKENATPLPASENPRLIEIKNRVNEIKDMDRSSMTRVERKALRKELRELNKEARAVKGVYLSVGAIIIIILLLILIL